MEELERRVLTLELHQQHERQLTDWQIDALSRRLQALETTPVSIPLPIGSIVKLALAILLPLMALAATGDLKAALRALTRSLGG